MGDLGDGVCPYWSSSQSTSGLMKSPDKVLVKILEIGMPLKAPGDCSGSVRQDRCLCRTLVTQRAEIPRRRDPMAAEYLRNCGLYSMNLPTYWA